MTKTIPGLHHITAISGPPQPNVDFFTGTLGQRLVKKTVNFDAPDVYHLYYGDEAGSPGTIMTFFPFVNAKKGSAGFGTTDTYAYAVPKGKFDEWVARLQASGAQFDVQPDRFGARVIRLSDPDDAIVELIETDSTASSALDGFHSATLWVEDIAPTAKVLTEVFGYEEAGHVTEAGEERLRLQAPGDARARIIDVIRKDGATKAKQGAGSIHHIAFRAETDEVQLHWRDALLAQGHAVTQVRDRQYFNAIYFREPGGVLFEIATDPPGFAVDEDPSSLGEALKLPPQYEARRAELEQVLPPIKLA